MAKTWIFFAQAIIFGCLTLFGLIFGPLGSFGFMKKVNGAPATDAGVALTVLSLLFLPIFLLAVFNINARRRPLLRLCREGIEFVEIGSSSLDGIPLIPGWFRLVWLILSMQGFKKRVVRISWMDFQEAWVSDPPMARRLTIDASTCFVISEEFPLDTLAADQLVLPEVMFSTPLDQIAATVNSHANSSMDREHLASWSESGSAHA